MNSSITGDSLLRASKQALQAVHLSGRQNIERFDQARTIVQLERSLIVIALHCDGIRHQSERD